MTRREIHSWLMDMDGVLVREENLIPGADRFIAALRRRELPFLLLTNNSIYTRRDLAARLRTSGLDVPEESIWTSALATAGFLADQRPGGSAFVIGESGLTTALHEQGYTLSERDPDYVVLGETRTYSFERITSAIRLIRDGARFIATNPDATGPSAQGPLPATGSVAALISRATGVEPYFVGKPNPLMMRSALNAIDAHSETTAMIGDRMDTDIVAGLEAGLETILVLSGVTARAEAERFPFRASRTLESVAEAGRRAGLSHAGRRAVRHPRQPPRARGGARGGGGGRARPRRGRRGRRRRPVPGETLERLAALGDQVRWVMGNADRMVIEAYDRGGPGGPRRRGRSPRRLGRAAAHARAARPARRASIPLVQVDGTLFCHGSPRSDDRDPHRGQLGASGSRRSSTGSRRTSSSAATPTTSSTAACTASGWSTPAASACPTRTRRRAYWLLARAASPSSGAPTTTSRRRWSGCARAACRASTS